MRKRLIAWHITLGRLASWLMILWALSGVAMILEPMATKWLDPNFPRLGPAAVDPALFLEPPGRLLELREPVASITLRQFGARAWYEIRHLNGSVVGMDARTGAEVPAFLTAAELEVKLTGQLGGSRWKLAGKPELRSAYDDHYRKDDLPVYRVVLQGPGSLVLYCSARDGSVAKTTTLWSRLFRWLGLGLHTWNAQYFKEHHDGPRRWLLVLLVALPILAMGVLAQLLLRPQNRRGREERKPRVHKAPPPGRESSR